MSNELTLEILEEAIDKIPKRRYPKRMRINPKDYRKLRWACDHFGILPEIKHNVSPGFGMEIVPDPEIREGCYELEYEEFPKERG